MIYNNLEFHNVDNLEEKKGIPGLLINRFPKYVQNNLGNETHQRGRFYCKTSAGCEIRFKTNSLTTRISLSAYEKDGEVSVFCGNYFLLSKKIKAGQITTIQIEKPEKFNLAEANKINTGVFSKDVYRICFDKNACFIFNDIEAFGNDITPPSETDKPNKKWLAYGSSITMGGNSLNYQTSYIALAARMLNVDVFNKSTAGSCFIDPPIVDYFANLKNWDFATLELGINMVNRFTEDEFKNRSENLIHKLSETNKLVFVISNYTNHFAYSLDSAIKEKNNNFKQILHNIVKSENRENLIFIDGREILTDITTLTCDLHHPSDYGHIQMAYNLANKIKPFLDTNF